MDASDFVIVGGGERTGAEDVRHPVERLGLGRLDLVGHGAGAQADNRPACIT